MYTNKAYISDDQGFHQHCRNGSVGMVFPEAVLAHMHKATTNYQDFDFVATITHRDVRNHISLKPCYQ